ncbi:MAG TPA: CoA ester lyase, partial [Candidatus Acidoferrum sp.]|nr:CoA ester lyase [Candidatus Acidoferrum sp.]
MSKEEIPLDSRWGTPEEGQPTGSDERRAKLRGLVRRSVLILPVNVPKFVEKAYARGADAIKLDLEDSIPLAGKGDARAMVRDAMRQCAKGGADVLVRINKPYALAIQDLEACVWPELDAVHFPKAESAREIATVDRLIGELEKARGIPAGRVNLSIAIETALGLHNSLSIALASSRIVDIALGPEDYTLDIGVEPSKDGRELFYGLARMIVVARLAGVQPLGTTGSIADYRDLEGWSASIRHARQMGFLGAACIHPDQVPPLNTYFSPTAAEVAAARKAMASFEAVQSEGRASVGVDGKMVDIPVVERARRVIVRATAIEAKEARVRAAFAALGEAPPRGGL